MAERNKERDISAQLRDEQCGLRGVGINIGNIIRGRAEAIVDSELVEDHSAIASAPLHSPAASHIVNTSSARPEETA